MFEDGVYINPGGVAMRMVTHYGVDSEDIDITLLAAKRALS